MRSKYVEKLKAAESGILGTTITITNALIRIKAAEKECITRPHSIYLPHSRLRENSLQSLLSQILPAHQTSAVKMVKEDLLEHAKSTVDFYDLLGVAFETSESDIRRAYRKTALKYHPDKLGKDFDPEKFHLLQIANDVLSDPAAKTAYDNARHARLQKVRQNELFEGKRKQMKDELEAREKGGVSAAAAGNKRPREEDEMEREIRRLAEEGKRRRREMEEKMRAHGGISPPTTTPGTPKPKPAAQTPEPPTSASAPIQPEEPQTAAEEAAEEDEIARLERLIAEASAAKARRKAEKKARKSGVFHPTDSPLPQSSTDTGAGPTGGSKWERAEKRETSTSASAATTTPNKRPDLFSSLKADARPSASASASSSPKFSFTPKNSGTPRAAGGRDEFAATMERLQEAEKRRLEEEIRREDLAAAEGS